MSILDKLFRTYREITDVSEVYAQLSYNKWMESLTYAVIGLTIISITVVFAAVADSFGILSNMIPMVLIALLSGFSILAVVLAWIKGVEAREFERKSIDEFLEKHPEQRDILEDKSGLERIKQRIKGNPWVYAPIAITVTYLLLELLF